MSASQRVAIAAAAFVLLAPGAAEVARGSAGPTADAAAKKGVKVSVVQGRAVQLIAAGAAENEWDVNSGDDPSVACGKKAPLTVGWSGATAPVIGTNVYLNRINSYVKIGPRRPAAAGPLKAVAVCASKVAATSKLGSGTSVDCGGKLTLGLAASETWPYIESAVAIGPAGPNGWSTEVGPRPRPSALCVPKSAFKKVTTVKASGTFAAGATTAAVQATCTGGRRVLAWGYDAPVMPGNVWSSADTDSKRSVPFVGDSVPTSGAKGWKVTFRTADGKPAAAEAPGLGVIVRCGVPAS